MIRISVTDLESWRYHRNSDDQGLDSLLRRLAHVEPPSIEMQAGKALAKFFESAQAGEQDAAVIDGWRILFDLDAEIDLPPIRELKIEEVFQTPSGQVTLVGQVDDLFGLTVRDQKLTKSFDVEEKYIDSLQWRAYLTMFRARRFIYDVFVGRVSEKDHEVTIRDYHPLTFYSYPGMRADVERAVRELAEIVGRYQPQIAALKGAA